MGNFSKIGKINGQPLIGAGFLKLSSVVPQVYDGEAPRLPTLFLKLKTCFFYQKKKRQHSSIKVERHIALEYSREIKEK